jgi:hypothetical protein
VKKFGGLVFLVAAVFLLLTARRSMTSDQKETDVLIHRMADAQQREGEIFRLKTAVLMENFDVTSKELDHQDPGAEKAQLEKDRAGLGQLETTEQKLGSAEMQESELKDVQNHHWVVMGEFVGGGMLGLLGVGLLL